MAAKSRELSFFAVAWAIAQLFHFSPIYALTDLAWLAILSAVMTILVPHPTMLAILCVSQVAVVLSRLPSVSNHFLFSGFCSTLLLLTGLSVILSPDERDSASETWWRRFAPFMRINLTILYFFVVFHKLNADFFNVELSCGSTFWVEQKKVIAWLPDSTAIRFANILVTLIVETAIPVLLWRKSTRLWGALLLVVFHGVIGFHPKSAYFNFSSMLYASVLSFVVEEVLSGADRVQARFPRVPCAAISLAFRVLVIVWLSFSRLTDTLNGRVLVGRSLWGLYLIVAVALVAGALRYPTLPWVKSGTQRAWRFVFALVPTLLILNGLGPYFGYKFEVTFAMYSNLRTDKYRWNHFLVPEGVKFVDWGDHLVYVRRWSVSPETKHAFLPVFELRRHLAGSKDPIIWTVENGRKRKIDVRKEHPEWLEPLTNLQRKLFELRAIRHLEKQKCKH